MNKKLMSVGAGFLSLGMLLSSCASSPKGMLADCTFPDSPEMAAPGWICDMPVDGVEVSAVGSFRKTAAGIQFQKTQATAAARNALASRMKVLVKRMVKNYASTTGVGDDETVDTVSSDVSKHVTNETLLGTKVFRTRVNPETRTMYVLIGMDPDGAATNAQTAIKSSYKNKKAMWQRFLAKKADEDLDAEIEKMTQGFVGGN